ncbi:MAG: DUF4296 domain-containing protein [Aquabacterium sp.]|nr:DUF4296 domain-containing protein [Ferruginibacter sp.]
MKKIFVIILMLSIAGCSENNSDGILAKEKMQAVMWDIIGADFFTEQFIKKDTLKNARIENMQLQNKIFALHKVSRADYYKSYDYYIAHTDLMRVILDSMTAKAERDRTKMMEEQHGSKQTK